MLHAESPGELGTLKNIYAYLRMYLFILSVRVQGSMWCVWCVCMCDVCTCVGVCLHKPLSSAPELESSLLGPGNQYFLKLARKVLVYSQIWKLLFKGRGSLHRVSQHICLPPFAVIKEYQSLRKTCCHE